MPVPSWISSSCSLVDSLCICSSKICYDVCSHRSPSLYCLVCIQPHAYSDLFFIKMWSCMSTVSSGIFFPASFSSLPFCQNPSHVTFIQLVFLCKCSVHFSPAFFSDFIIGQHLSSVIILSNYSNLPLRLSSEFFFSLVLFSSRISILKYFLFMEVFDESLSSYLPLIFKKPIFFQFLKYTLQLL